MERDRQIFLVDRPELLKEHFGLRAGIDEKQRRLVIDELSIDIRDRIFGGMAGPGDALLCIENGDIGLGTAFDKHEAGVVFLALLLRHQPFLQIQGFGHGG